MSRLLYNLHILVLTHIDIKRLASVYMRGLRRIAGDCRFSSEVKHTDLEVRILLSVPSLDCMLAVSRLRYLGRVVRLKPHSLCTLLHCHVGDRVLPWVALLSRDCDDLRARGLVPTFLGPFLQDPSAWHSFIADESAWARAVRSLHFSDSVLDAQSSHTAPLQSGRALAFACSDCKCMFPSARALASHRRSKHGARSEFRKFVPSSVCPACGTYFSTRVRCLGHISDNRRPKCADWLLKHGTAVPPATLVRLDETDRVHRREAQQQGLSGPRATAPARNAQGRVIGRPLA